MTQRSIIAGLCAGTLLLTSQALAEPARFATPQDALEAFVAGLEDPRPATLLAVFGEEAEELLADDDPRVNAARRAEILALYGQGYRFRPDDSDRVTLVFGAEGWPFPIPLARSEQGWSFDIAAGAEEIRTRQIGLNELDVIALMDAYVDLQAAYRLVDHDGDGVMEFAPHILSSAPDLRDGLFWDGPESPVGLLMALAAMDGYSDAQADAEPEPHLGYVYRILNAQTDAAPGGAMSYVVNGNQVAGHALLAVPAEYGQSGVHSFLVAENGVILEADLGPDSLDRGAEITAYDPGTDWTEVE